MSYKVFWADKKAKKAFDSLSSLIGPRIGQEIQALAGNPRPQGCKMLSGRLKNVWRIRIGDYRLLYDSDDKAKKVVLLDLGHRRQIYR